MVFERGPRRFVRSHGNESDLTESVSAERMPRPAQHRRASVCIADHTFMYPVGWTSY